MKKETKKWIFIGVVIFIILISIVGFASGYRLRSNLTVGKIGYLTMNIPLAQTSIFIDQSRKIVTSKENELINLPFSPSKHSVIVSHDGYFPWKKDFIVPSAKTISISPIFVNQNASGLMIGQSDPEYYKIRNSIIKSKLPTKELPILSPDKLTSVWVEDNAILAKIASTTQILIQPDTIIKSVDFYKNRSDAVIFSTYNAVYVLEIDEVDNRNFIPIYKGENPSFVRSDENSIYVLDGNNLMQVAI